MFLYNSLQWNIENKYNTLFDTCHITVLNVVIITKLGQNKNQHKMLKIQQIFPKLYRYLLYVVFHDLEHQNAGLIDVNRDLN